MRCNEVWRIDLHSRPVSVLAFSPDGKRALSGGHDGKAHLLDVESKELVSTFNHETPIRAGAFTLDGKQATFFCDDRTIHIWDTNSLSKMDEFPILGKRADYQRSGLGRRYPTAAAFSPDGQSVLVGSQDKTVYLVRVEPGAKSRRFRGHSMPVFGVGFTEPGGPVWSFGQNDALRFWQVESRKEIRRFGKSEFVFAAAVSKDACLVVTATHRRLKVWDGVTGKYLYRIRRSFFASESAATLAFVSESHRLLCGTWQGVMALWDLDARQQIARWKGHDTAVQRVAVSSDGRRVLSGGAESHDIKLWDFAES